jgi:phosphoribosylglycinamide formyltransferase-1
MLMHRIAVFVSGVGSTLEYLIKRSAIERTFQVVVVVSDVICPALDIARTYGIPVVVRKYVTKEQFTRDVMFDLVDFKPLDLIVCAGLMRLLGTDIIRRYPRRILNSHPALPGMFPGPQVIEETLKAKIKTTGCTIMYVDEGVDDGEVIDWVTGIPVLPMDVPGTLRARIQEQEKPLYYDAICKVLREMEK